MALSYIEFTGDGGTTYVTIPFDYISTDHIKLYVDDVAIEPLKIEEGVLYMKYPPSLGSKVVVCRETPIDKRLVAFKDTSLLNKQSLDLAFLQMYYIIQEKFEQALRVEPVEDDDDDEPSSGEGSGGALFASFRVDENGWLCMDYFGDTGSSSDFHINAEGYLMVEV